MDNASSIRSHFIEEFDISIVDSTSMTIEFIENLEKLYHAAREALTENCWEDLDRLGHSVKGTSGNVGADKTAVLGCKLQEACAAKDIDGYHSTLEELNQALELLKKSQEDL